MMESCSDYKNPEDGAICNKIRYFCNDTSVIADGEILPLYLIIAGSQIFFQYLYFIKYLAQGYFSVSPGGIGGQTADLLLTQLPQLRGILYNGLIEIQQQQQ